MSGFASNTRSGFWKWVRDIGFVGAVIGSIWAAGQSVVRALDWIYVDLGKQAIAIQGVVTKQAETNAVVDQHTKILERMDSKLDRLFVPAPQQK